MTDRLRHLIGPFAMHGRRLDPVTAFGKVRHPGEAGIRARKGVEL
jgi:hypothetical protein